MISPVSEPRPITVLVSETVRPEFIAGVEGAGSNLTVVTVADRGPLPSEVGSAQVLHRSIGFRNDRVQEILEHATELEWMHIPFAGVDGLLPPILRDRKIAVTHASGIYDEPVAEYALAQILSIAKRLRHFDAQQRAGRWAGVGSWDDASGTPQIPTMLRGKTVGILGFGGIGGALAAMLAPLQARVLGFRRIARPDPRAVRMYGPEGLLELLGQCDYVVLALPLTEETRALIGSRELAALKPGAWLINVGRGALIDEAALIDALEGEAIGGACLDVFAQEPLPSGHAFYRLPNAIITPHISGVFENRTEADLELFLEELRRFLEGEPFRGLVDLARGY